MPVFVQLSKHQRKFHDHATRVARNAQRHDAQFPGQKTRAEAQKALENEVQALAQQQAKDAAATATPIEVVRFNNALKAQANMAVRKAKVTP